MSILDQVQTSGVAGVRYPKVLCYGPPGSGKTVTALAIAQALGRRLIAIDADGGCEAYVHDPAWAGVFDVVTSSDPVEVCRALDDLLINPRGYGVLLLDSISTVWRDGEYSVEGAARRKNQDKRLTEYESAWNLSLWNPTKRLAWQITKNIHRLKMPIVCTARQANKWEGGKVTGEKPEGDAQIGYEFDIVANLSQFHPQSPRVAVIEKDRLHQLPARIEGDAGNPFWFAQALLNAYPQGFGCEAVANPRASNEQIARLYELQGQILEHNPDVSHVQIVDWIRSSFSEDCYENLSPEQATLAIRTLEARLGQEPKA